MLPCFWHSTRSAGQGGRRPEDRSAATSPASWIARIAWGVFGLLLPAWTVFEAVRHTGLTIAFAMIGLLVPFLARLAPGLAPVCRHGGHR
ncbi:hypothetical protein GCM10020367_62810 [Streptomyces sannanensis]|uniref:Uncharacterized protein n=1 Tax=Streptomyces sannanensis TaxID=285536 RepID=A0ABP6SLA7_9ACTN